VTHACFSDSFYKMSFQAGALIRHFPAMVKLGAATISDAITRLYRRAYWRKKGVHVEPTARLIYASDKMMELGYGVHVGLFTVLVAYFTPACEEVPLLKVGERTWIGDQVNIRATGGLITIGSHCLIANAVTIISCTHGLKPDVYVRDQPLIRGDVDIGDDVWIGAGVMIMPGSKIGQGAVIGAGAVVRGTVEPYEIVVGIPAKSIGSRKDRA
jgi:acetyltransferase-like isoleucine patch superfamily enzyme